MQTSLPSKHTIITLSDCNDSDYYSSSFEMYENNTKSKSINIYNNMYNSNSNSNSVINESTDYMQSDSDESNNINSNRHFYDYPWPTSSDDSFANLSETEVYEKLSLKLSQMPNQSHNYNITNPITNLTKPKIKPDIKLTINTKLEPILPLKSLSKGDSEYFKHGRFVSVIIHTTPINDINYISEYEADNEENENENENKILNVTPIQSTCDEFNSDLFGCNLNDLD